MPSFVLLDPGIRKRKATCAEKKYMTYKMFSRLKVRKIYQNMFYVGESGPLIIKLDNVIPF